jgi:hypothetical protein
VTALDAFHALWTASIATPTDLKTNAARDIIGALNLVLADVFALYLKKKSGHFAAREQPEPLSTEKRAAFRSRQSTSDVWRARHVPVFPRPTPQYRCRYQLGLPQTTNEGD